MITSIGYSGKESQMISVKSNIADVTRNLSKIQRKQVPFAASMALNDTAFGLQKEIKRQMPQKLDRPTPWTISGVQVKKSTKKNLTAVVYMAGADGLPKQNADRNKYIKYQVNGGTRTPKKTKIPVPYTKNMKLNKYGNMPRNKIKSLVGDKEKNMDGKAGVFVGNVKGIDGIWQRKRKNGLKLLVAFESVAHYGKRLPFNRIGEGFSLNKFTPNFTRALVRALESAR